MIQFYLITDFTPEQTPHSMCDVSRKNDDIIVWWLQPKAAKFKARKSQNTEKAFQARKMVKGCGWRAVFSSRKFYFGFSSCFGLIRLVSWFIFSGALLAPPSRNEIVLNFILNFNLIERIILRVCVDDFTISPRSWSLREFRRESRDVDVGKDDRSRKTGNRNSQDIKAISLKHSDLTAEELIIKT